MQTSEKHVRPPSPTPVAVPCPVQCNVPFPYPKHQMNATTCIIIFSALCLYMFSQQDTPGGECNNGRLTEYPFARTPHCTPGNHQPQDVEAEGLTPADRTRSNPVTYRKDRAAPRTLTITNTYIIVFYVSRLYTLFQQINVNYARTVGIRAMPPRETWPCNDVQRSMIDPKSPSRTQSQMAQPEWYTSCDRSSRDPKESTKDSFLHGARLYLNLACVYKMLNMFYELPMPKLLYIMLYDMTELVNRILKPILNTTDTICSKLPILKSLPLTATFAVEESPPVQLSFFYSNALMLNIMCLTSYNTVNVFLIVDLGTISSISRNHKMGQAQTKWPVISHAMYPYYAPICIIMMVYLCDHMPTMLPIVEYTLDPQHSDSLCFTIVSLQYKHPKTVHNTRSREGGLEHTLGCTCASLRYGSIAMIQTASYKVLFGPKISNNLMIHVFEIMYSIVYITIRSGYEPLFWNIPQFYVNLPYVRASWHTLNDVTIFDMRDMYIWRYYVSIINGNRSISSLTYERVFYANPLFITCCKYIVCKDILVILNLTIDIEETLSLPLFSPVYRKYGDSILYDYKMSRDINSYEYYILYIVLYFFIYGMNPRQYDICKTTPNGQHTTTQTMPAILSSSRMLQNHHEVSSTAYQVASHHYSWLYSTKSVIIRFSSEICVRKCTLYVCTPQRSKTHSIITTSAIHAGCTLRYPWAYIISPGVPSEGYSFLCIVLFIYNQICQVAHKN